MKKIKIHFVDFWWDESKNNKNRFYLFLSEFFNVELSDKPDFLFFSVFGNKHKKYKDCVKILITWESRPGNIDFKGYDFAISQFYIDNVRHYYLPSYGWKLMLSEKLRDHFTTIKDADKLINTKNKFCLFIVSNKKCRQRNKFFKTLSKYKKVDSAGKVLNNTGIFAPPGEKYFDFIRPYKFMIAFENTSRIGYTTEKIFNPLIVNTVPIYWGNPLIHTEFNENCFINLYSHRNEKEVIDKIIEIDNNNELYKKYLKGPYFPDNKIHKNFDKQNLINFFSNIFKINS